MSKHHPLKPQGQSTNAKTKRQAMKEHEFAHIKCEIPHPLWYMQTHLVQHHRKPSSNHHGHNEEGGSL
jgi:hypothetical protein